MPELDGIEATTLIRKTLPSNNQPTIIALTADAFQETKQKCLNAGMQNVITKPIKRNILEQTLYKYLTQ
jgi:CheY-like chemotaxis protein